MLHVLPPPPGFVALGEAVEMVGRKVGADLDVYLMIAEACESGKVAAAYRSDIGGADDLDCSVWQLPHWRSFFETGTIDLDLPLLDGRRRPNPSGFTARCTREIFVRRDSLDDLSRN